MSNFGPVGSTQPHDIQTHQDNSTPHAAPHEAPHEVPEAAAKYERHVAPFTRPFGIAGVDALEAALRTFPATVFPLRVLDHGSGTGQVARLVNERIPASRVCCLDPSADFLSVGPCAPNEPWASRITGTSDDLPTDARFDGVISVISLPFVPDVASDLARVRAAMATDAVLVAVTLGSIEDIEPFNAYWAAFASIEDRFWSPDRYPHSRLGDPEVFVRAIESGGFSSVSVHPVSATRSLTVHEVWEWLSSALPLGFEDGYSQVAPEAVSEAHRRFITAQGDRTSWTTTCLIATARR